MVVVTFSCKGRGTEIATDVSNDTVLKNHPRLRHVQCFLAPYDPIVLHLISIIRILCWLWSAKTGQDLALCINCYFLVLSL